MTGGGTEGQRQRRTARGLPGQVARWLEQWLVPLVLVVAAFGVAFPIPGRLLAGADGIPVALAVLVASTGVSITLGQLRQARDATGRLIVIVAVTSVVLPAMAWAASHLTGPGPLRDGVLATGVAPAEVASVALAGIGGGDAALTAALLVGSTLVTVLAAGPILTALGAAATVRSTTLLTQLALVVALPLATGITTRATFRLTRAALAISAAVGTLALLVLLWQVASQITLQAAYLPVALALLAFIAGSAVLGWLLTAGLPPARRLALALPVAMRDFAVAAGIATAAFGPAAAAPLGIYGVLVLLAGALAAQLTHRKR